MKRGLVLFPKYVSERSSTAFDWWLTSGKRLNMDITIGFFEDCTIRTGSISSFYLKGKEQFDIDFVIMRGYCEEISRYFEIQGIPVFNKWEAMALSRNKMLTHICLSKAGLPSPATIYGGEVFNLPSSRLHFPLIVKQLESSRGENVFLVHDEDEYSDAVKACGGKALIQEYISSSHGQDLRVWVVGDHAVGAVRRFSDTDFRSNFSQGGKAEAVSLEKKAEELAVRATQCLGLDFAGVDLLFMSDDYTICEVNGNAGFRTLSLTSDIDIIGDFLLYINGKL